MSSAILNKCYELARDTPSDINEHIETLYNYAIQCDSIAELGVRAVVSSWAFAKGLADGVRKLNNKVFIGVDLVKSQNVNILERVCLENKIIYEFVTGNSAAVGLPPVDIVFIDTWHCYAHLIRELYNLCHCARKWIIMHDTTVDGEVGESVRCNFDIEKQSKESGYPVSEIRMGLWSAINEFLNTHKEWKLEHRYTNNNGLTILRREPIDIDLYMPVKKYNVYERNQYTQLVKNSLLNWSTDGLNQLDFLQDTLADLKVQGDLLQVGVKEGNGSILMKSIVNYLYLDRRVIVFDSFEGDTLDTVISKFNKYNLVSDRVLFVKGSIENFKPKRPIALLRIDCDYTEQVLNAMYDNVAIGGYIIILNNEVNRPIAEKFIQERGINSTIKYIDTEAFYFIKGTTGSIQY